MDEDGTMATLTLSQVVYQFKAVEEQARDLLESTKHVFDNLVFARAIRAQKAQHLNESERSWIDGVLVNTDKTLDNVRALIEPARVDMQTNFGSVGFVNRSLFVLRDSPKVQTNLARLTIASGSLDNVLGILLSRPGTTNAPITPQTLSPHNSINSEPNHWQPRMNRIASDGALSTISRFSDPPGYPSPAPSNAPGSPVRLSIPPPIQERSPQRLDPTHQQQRPYSRSVSENVIELADTSSEISVQRRQSSQRSHDGLWSNDNRRPDLQSHPSFGRTLAVSDDDKISVSHETLEAGLGLRQVDPMSQQYQQHRQTRNHQPVNVPPIYSSQQAARPDRRSGQYAPEAVGPATNVTQRRPLPSQQRFHEDMLARQKQTITPNSRFGQGQPLDQAQYAPQPVYTQDPRLPVRPVDPPSMHQRQSISSISTTLSPRNQYSDDKSIVDDSIAQGPPSRASGRSRRKDFLAYQATR